MRYGCRWYLQLIVLVCTCSFAYADTQTVTTPDGISTHYLDGTNVYSTPSGGGGSGTVTSSAINTVARYNAAGTTVQGSAILFDNGTNVGVGTVGPVQAFEVNGTAKATLFSGPGAISTLTINKVPMSLTATTLTDSNLNQQNSNIGIGTTGPSALFSIGSTSQYQVNSSGQISKIDGTANAQFTKIQISGDASGADLVVVNNRAAASSNLALKTGTGGSNVMKFFTNGSEVMRLDASGNLGIGTFSSISKLGIVGNVGIGTILNGDLFLNTAPPNGGMIVEGNVGIGTITPGAQLDIGGNLRLATGGFLVSQQTTAPTVASNDCGTTSQGTVGANSSDLLGTVVAGTLNVTSCAMTFNKTHANNPICFCQDKTNVLAVDCSETTTKMTITSLTSMSGDTIKYFCPTNIP